MATPSRLDRLVRRLCGIGDGSTTSVAMLIQKNANDAVVVIREYGDVLVLLETAPGEVGVDELESRVQPALCREHEDVLVGLRSQTSYLVRIVTPGWVPGSPTVAPAGAPAHGLKRAQAVLRLDAAGAVVETTLTIPGRRDDPAAVERVLGTLSEAWNALDPEAADAPTPGSELAEAEAHGEALVASEGIFGRLQTRPPGVIGVTLLMMAIHAARQLTWDPSSTQSLLRMGANLGQLVISGEFWRVVTGGYLHADISHLVNNAVLFWIFGSFVEAAFGTGRFLLAYTFLLAASEGITAIVRPDQVGYGASGGVLGLVAFVAVMNWKGSKRAPPFSGSGWGCLGVIFLTNEVLHAFDPAVSFVAHFAGAMAGALLAASRVLEWGLGPLETEWRLPRRPFAGGVLGLVAFVLTLGAMTIALDRYRPWSYHEPGKPVLARWKESGLEALIPASLAPRQVTEDGEGWVRHRIGHAQLDLLVISILQRDHEFDDGDGAAAAAHLTDTLQSEGRTVDPGKMWSLQTGSRTMAWYVIEESGPVLIRYLGAIGGREVDVQVSLEKGTPEGWQTLARTTVESLRRP